MQHSYMRLLGSAAVPLFVLGVSFAAPQQNPSVPLLREVLKAPGVLTRVLQAPVIKTEPFSYGNYVTYADPDAFRVDPSLPDKPMDVPKGSLSQRDLLARALADTGFTLEMDAESQKILEKSPHLYFGAERLTAAQVIDSAIRVLKPDALDYSVDGRTIKVFPAAKDADGFTLRRVSVDAQDASLKDVLTDLLGHTGYRLFLPMRLNAKITVQCRDVTVGEAIRAVLAAAPSSLGTLESFRMVSGGSGSGHTLFIGQAKQEAK